MGLLAITNAFIYAGPVDITGTADELNCRAEAETRESTNMRSGGWRAHKNTLKASTVSNGGFWTSDSANDLDPEAFANLGTTNQVITCGMQETEGELAHIMRHMSTQYTLPQGSVGDLAKFMLESSGSDGQIGQIRCKLFKKYGVVSATGATGTGIQLGAVGAAQFLYGALHTFGTPGSSITVIAQSDDNSGFTTPTTRATFNGGAITTAAGFWLTPVAGAVADDYWRLSISAITGTWVIAGSLGIR